MRSVCPTHAMVRADLDAVQRHVEPYDIDAGAARLAAALAATTVAATLGAETSNLLSGGAAALEISRWVPVGLAVVVGAAATVTLASFAGSDGGSRDAASRLDAPATVQSVVPIDARVRQRVEPLEIARALPSAAEAIAPAPWPPPPSTHRLAVTRRPAPATAPTPRGRSIGDEVRELAALKQLLSSDPAKTLRGIDDRPQMPSDVMTQERAILAIEALVSLGRVGEAGERSRAFLATYPESAYAPRARRWVSGAR